MKKRQALVSPSGTFALFIFRGFGQTSQQATVERAPNPRPLIIPRTGTAAPIGVATMVHKPLDKR